MPATANVMPLSSFTNGRPQAIFKACLLVMVLVFAGEPKRLLHREEPSRCDRGLGC